MPLILRNPPPAKPRGTEDVRAQQDHESIMTGIMLIKIVGIIAIIVQ